MDCSNSNDPGEGIGAQAFRRLLEDGLQESEFAWWEWDIPKNRVSFNDHKVTMLGYDAADFADVGYEAFTSLLHPDDYERTMEAMRRHLAGDAAIYQIDYRVKRADGQYEWYMDRGCTIERSEDGSPARLRGLVVDLGEEFHRRAHSEALSESFRRALPGPGDTEASVTVCALCEHLKISNKEWVPIPEALPRAFPRAVSHGICIDCLRVLYPDQADELIDLLLAS